MPGGCGTASRTGGFTASGLLAIALVLALATVPLWSGGSFSLARYVLAITYLMVAVGVNLAMGYAGEFVLGHPAIMGVSAYTAGLLAVHLKWPAPLTLLCAIVAGVLCGLLIMSPGLRVRGWYYSLITLFSVLVLPPIALMGEKWTGGADGLSNIPAISFFGERLPDWALFEISLAGFALVWWATDNFIRSGWGYRLRALRDARHAAEAAGIDLMQVRLAVYLISSVPAAFAGFIIAYSTRFVGVDMFGINLTLLLLTGVVLGGAGTRWGPLLGMAPLLILSFWVGPFSPYNAVGLGFGLLVGTLLFPNGVISALQALSDSRGKRGSPALTQPAAPPPTVALAPLAGSSAAAAATGQPILHARDVVKRFGGQTVLAGVEFAMRPSSLVGLVGSNGSGKSTFLNIVSGFLRSDGGGISVDGATVTGRPAFEIARMGIGRTFQVPQLVDEFTVLENIEIGLAGTEPAALFSSLVQGPLIRRRRKLRHERAQVAFDLVGLPGNVAHVPVSTLPLGLKRIVEIARALVAGPKLLLLDEPGAGLNDEERDRLGVLLRKLRDRGVSVLVIEHNVGFLMEYCEELVLLDAGRVSCVAPVCKPLPQPLLDYLSLKVS